MVKFNEGRQKWRSRKGGGGREGIGVTRRKETIVTERCGGCVDILVLNNGPGLMKEDRNGGTGRGGGGGVKVNTHEGKRPEKHVTPIRTTTFINYTTNKQRQNVTRVTLYLCSINTGAGCLSPHNDTLQLQDRYGGSNDDDDESEDGDGSCDHDVLQHVKELGVVQVYL